MRVRQILAICTTAVIITAVPGLEGQAHASADRAAEMVIAKTGTLGTELPAAGGRADTGYRLKPAEAGGRALRTWVQRESGGMRFVSELTPGDSQGTFPDLVPEDMTMRGEADGSVVVLGPGGEKAGRIAPPWAIDATGRSLPTSYVIEGRGLRQTVDTRGATYPVVMDPWVTTGWWYTTPVYYVELSWSETWSLKLTLDKDTSNVPGLLCGYIPTPTGRIVCGAVYLAVKGDVKATVNAAINAHKCYKARIPATGSAIALPAYDSYYKTCLR